MAIERPIPVGPAVRRTTRPFREGISPCLLNPLCGSPGCRLLLGVLRPQHPAGFGPDRGRDMDRASDRDSDRDRDRDRALVPLARNDPRPGCGLAGDRLVDTAGQNLPTAMSARL